MATKKSPHFDTDWFSYAIPNFQAIKNHLGTVDSILEIGVYQGRSTCWMLEKMLSDNGNITCVDPFIETDKTEMFFSREPLSKGSAREKLFRQNTSCVKKSTQNLEILVGRSYNMLSKLLAKDRSYDFIYRDGNHAASAVLADAVFCFGLLRPGGILLFDDYLWDHVPNHHDRPKMSIDTFTNMFANHIRIGTINYQYIVIKNDSEHL